MQLAFDAREDKTSLLLPCAASLVHMMCLGGGGCGKTLMLTTVLFPLLETFFGPR